MTTLAIDLDTLTAARTSRPRQCVPARRMVRNPGRDPHAAARLRSIAADATVMDEGEGEGEARPRERVDRSRRSWRSPRSWPTCSSSAGWRSVAPSSAGGQCARCGGRRAAARARAAVGLRPRRGARRLSLWRRTACAARLRPATRSSDGSGSDRRRTLTPMGRGSSGTRVGARVRRGVDSRTRAPGAGLSIRCREPVVIRQPQVRDARGRHAGVPPPVLRRRTPGARDPSRTSQLLMRLRRELVGAQPPRSSSRTSMARARAGVWRKRRVLTPTADATEMPTFHVYASAWLESKVAGVLGDRPIDTNTENDYRWRLRSHLDRAEDPDVQRGCRDRI